MKVEITYAWPLFGEFYNQSSPTFNCTIILPQSMDTQLAASDKIPPIPEDIQKMLTEIKPQIGVDSLMNVRGLLLHKLYLLLRAKGTRKSLVNFMIFLLNNGIYPKVLSNFH